MQLHFYGADRCVTGSCHCIEVNGKKILIDCGLQQGRDELDNHMLPFRPGTIDYVLVTHAHIDHSGRLPLLVKQGFSGQIHYEKPYYGVWAGGFRSLDQAVDLQDELRRNGYTTLIVSAGE